MNREWEERLNALMDEIGALGEKLSAACEDFERAGILPDGDAQEEAADHLDEASDCLEDAKACLSDALRIIRR